MSSPASITFGKFEYAYLVNRLNEFSGHLLVSGDGRMTVCNISAGEPVEVSVIELLEPLCPLFCYYLPFIPPRPRRVRCPDKYRNVRMGSRETL